MAQTNPGPPERSLAGIGILAKIPPSERGAIERRCAWRGHPAGSTIIDRETPSRDVYFVVAGTVRVVNFSASGREVSLAEVAPGHCFGELSAIDGQPRSAHVVAVSDALTAALPQQAFVDLLTRYPGAALALIARLAAVVRSSTDRIMDLSTMGAHNRIYAELLRLSEPSQANIAVIRPIPIHADLAARVSTSRETVARALSHLVKESVLEKLDDVLMILDVARLQTMVQQFRNE